MASTRIKLNRSGFCSVMKSPGVVAQLGYSASRAAMRAEAASGLRVGHGVDLDGPVSAHGWVGASAVDRRTGKVNRGLLARLQRAMAQALYGI